MLVLIKGVPSRPGDKGDQGNIGPPGPNDDAKSVTLREYLNHVSHC